MKVNVQVCANLGDEKKPRAWSKYATDSTAYKKIHKDDIPENAKPVKNKLSKEERNRNKIKSLLKKVNFKHLYFICNNFQKIFMYKCIFRFQHKNDPLFTEFIEAHVNEKSSWIKNALEECNKSDEDSGVEDENITQEEPVSATNTNITSKNAENKEIASKKISKVANSQISDLEVYYYYLIIFNYSFELWYSNFL